MLRKGLKLFNCATLTNKLGKTVTDVDAMLYQYQEWDH